jgi:hypothetical protein
LREQVARIVGCMSESPDQMTVASTQALAPDEQCEFDLIIAQARSAGWIGTDQEITAERCGTLVLVRSPRTPRLERHYPDGQRWLFELLHDLAHGLWKQKAANA